MATNTSMFKSAKIPTATHKSRHFNYQCEHITSSDFCQLNVAKTIRMSPKSKISMNFRSFARLASLSVPTFGRANMNIRAFYVPYSCVFPNWDKFITDTAAVDANGIGVPTTCPQVDNTSFVRALIRQSTSVSGTPTKDQYDFCSNVGPASTYTLSASKQYYKLNQTGARMLKLLHSLGYAPQFWIVKSDSTYTAGDSAAAAAYQGVLTFNALPLMCFLKVYRDWYYPSQYQSQNIIRQLDQLFEVPTISLTLDHTLVDTVLNIFTCIFYDADYFTGAFDSPLGPPSGNYSNISIPDPTVDSAQLKGVVTNYQLSGNNGSPNGTPTINNGNLGGSSFGHLFNLSDYALHALKALTSYTRRHQLAGSRAVDRYLARFGVTLGDERLKRSRYLGNHEIPLMTGDVMSTANVSNSQGSSLGSYAGKGFLAGADGHFEYETNDYGMFILLYSIVPHVGYYQGADRGTLYKGKLDFITPEFDGLGNRSIAKAELFVPMQDDGYGMEYFKQVFYQPFGFTPQYAEDKVARDLVTGDYRLATRSAVGATSPSWHLMRDLSDDFNTDVDIVHSLNFLNSSLDKDEYSRIFQYTSNDFGDHFFCHFFFGYSIQAPMLPLFDNFDFEEEGKKISMHINGSKLD